MFKRFFDLAKGAKAEDEALSIDDLIVLERFDEAAGRLQARLKTKPNDRHARLKLAEVYVSLKRGADAMDQYREVVLGYAGDGFHDKATAVLNRMQRLMPLDTGLKTLALKIDQAKTLVNTKGIVVDALRTAVKRQSGDVGAIDLGNLELELEIISAKLAPLAVAQELGAGQLRRLLPAMRPVRFAVEEKLASEGQDLAMLVVMLDGELVARQNAIVLRSFSAGQIVGDSALFERQPWAADYVFQLPSTVLCLDRDGLERALTGNPDPRALLAVLRGQQHDRQDRTLAQAGPGG